MQIGWATIWRSCCIIDYSGVSLERLSPGECSTSSYPTGDCYKDGRFTAIRMLWASMKYDTIDRLGAQRLVWEPTWSTRSS